MSWNLPSDRRWIRFRIAVVATAMLVAAGAIARGGWDLGVTRREELRDLAKDQYTRRISVPARRGMITDRHGEELAVEVEADSIYAQPQKIKNAAAVATMLAPVLEIDEQTLFSRLASKRHFAWLKRRVPPAIHERVKQLDLDGVDFVKESKRFYPNRGLASHITGFAGIDSVGLEGIELKFDTQLRGQQDAIEGLRDARGYVVFANKMFGPQGVVGSTVELTIDRTIQYIVEQELKATVRAFNAKAGHVIVMKPQTGEILALANWPSYNANAITDSTPQSRRNRAVLDVFEPGSTYKVFTLAAVLNAGAVRPDDLIFCERGRLEMYDTVIRDDHRDGWLNPTQCIKRSSNICTAKMALKLGKKRLYHYLRRFGFGERTHIDLPFEGRGVLHHYRKWYEFDAATIAFGQGVGVTGVQMAAALSAVANGGVLMRPLLVKRIVGPDGETLRTFAPQSRRRVISRYTARLVTDMMTSVTETGGTGTEGALKGFLVAGKTGTAQKSVGGKGYQEDKWTASFIAIVPADSPRLVITVTVDEPLISHTGGTVAAPAVRRIADQALRYLGVSPRKSGRRQAKSKTAKTTTDKKSSDPIDLAQIEGLPPEAFVEPEPAALGPDEVHTPDLLGMTMIQAMETLSASELRPVFIGTGLAIEQVPPPGDPLKRGEFVQVNFKIAGDEPPEAPLADAPVDTPRPKEPTDADGS